MVKNDEQFKNPGYSGKKIGVRKPRWRNGYIEEWCPIRKRYVYQHRLVIENFFGRTLSSSEIIHHKDGNKLNNDISNLEYHESRSSHIKEHVKESTWAGKGKPRPSIQKKKVSCPICKELFKPKRRTDKNGVSKDTKTCSFSCGQFLRQRNLKNEKL